MLILSLSAWLNHLFNKILLGKESLAQHQANSTTSLWLFHVVSRCQSQVLRDGSQVASGVLVILVLCVDASACGTHSRQIQLYILLNVPLY